MFRHPISRSKPFELLLATANFISRISDAMVNDITRVPRILSLFGVCDIPKAGVTFSLAQFSTTSHMQIETLHVYTTQLKSIHKGVFHVYWKMGAYQNVTPGSYVMVT